MMAETDDYAAIAKVIETYIEGAKTGDVGLLFPIFHEKARLFGEGPPPGIRWDLDRDAYLQMQAKEPLNKGGKYRARLVSVKQMGPSAVAVVEEDGCWEDNVSFVDIFSLSRIDGAWKIVNKTYTHRDAVNAIKATQEASASDASDEPSKTLPDKRPDMSWRDHLVMLLTFGATAEHCLMVQYLYAAYSLKVESSDPPERRQLIENWRHNILAVAREEMGHLLTVQNLLLLLGAPAALGRDSSVWAQNYYPYPFSLEPLTLDTLACFVYAEMPHIDPDKDIDPDKAEDDEQKKKLVEFRALLKDVIGKVEGRFGDPKHRFADGRMPLDAHRVAELYQQIIDVINNPKLIPDSTFDESSYEYQASWDEWGRGYKPNPYLLDAGGNKVDDDRYYSDDDADGPDDDPDEPGAPRAINVGRSGASVLVRLGASDTRAQSYVRVDKAATRTEAVEALHRIAKQGEAPHLGFNKRLKKSVEPELSHFDRFIAVYRELKAETDKSKGWSPAQGVCSNPTTRQEPPHLEAKYAQLQSVVAKRLGQMFNIRYRLLLNYLGHIFRLAKTRPVDRPNVRALLMHRVFGEMYNLKTLAGLLVRTPLGDETDGRWAAPPFEMPYSFTLPDADADVWRQHHELIGTSLEACKKLLSFASRPDAAGRAAKGHLTATGAEAYLRALHDLDSQTRDWFDAILADETPKGPPRDRSAAIAGEGAKGATRS
jgi:hypothetical protein